MTISATEYVNKLVDGAHHKSISHTLAPTYARNARYYLRVIQDACEHPLSWHFDSYNSLRKLATIMGKGEGNLLKLALSREIGSYDNVLIKAEKLKQRLQSHELQKGAIDLPIAPDNANLESIVNTVSTYLKTLSILTVMSETDLQTVVTEEDYNTLTQYLELFKIVPGTYLKIVCVITLNTLLSTSNPSDDAQAYLDEYSLDPNLIIDLVGDLASQAIAKCSSQE